MLSKINLSEQDYDLTIPTPTKWGTWNTYGYFKEVLRYVLQFIRYMKYATIIFGFKDDAKP